MPIYGLSTRGIWYARHIYKHFPKKLLPIWSIYDLFKRNMITYFQIRNCVKTNEQLQMTISTVAMRPNPVISMFFVFGWDEGVLSRGDRDYRECGLSVESSALDVNGKSPYKIVPCF